MAQVETIADKMQSLANAVVSVARADDDLAQQLAPQYPMTYDRIRRYIDGANGDLRLARLALDSNVPVSVLLSLQAMNKGS